MTRLTEMILNLLEKHYVARRVDHVDGDARAPEASRASNAVQVRLEVGLSVGQIGQIEVDNHRHLLDVEAARRHVRSDQHLIQRAHTYYSIMGSQRSKANDSHKFFVKPNHIRSIIRQPIKNQV